MRYAKEQGKTEDIESIEILEEVREKLDESGIFGIQFLFERLKDRVNDSIRKMAEELHNGHISALPVKDACTWCQYKDVCKPKIPQKNLHGVSLGICVIRGSCAADFRLAQTTPCYLTDNRFA